MGNVAAIIGGGVIGGGWAARFLLNGWDVRVFDPDPEAERKIGEVLANARRSLPGLGDVALPPEGTLTFHADMAEAVAGAAWVQESVPERLDIKQKVYTALMDCADEGAVIGSSTSGFKPSELQEGLSRPGQVVVTHPFNPVYLLPVIELVTTAANDQAMADKAMATLRAIGMEPVHIKKEIDAHVADRLLEAVWREALWLVKDEIATTEEIDNIMRYGFGLRWAQMGLFETYRVAGGEAGMKHFMAQFGPCLSWPWTKLMDVPEFTDELVDLIAGQSDAQSGHKTIRELERERDGNLVGILRALKAQGNAAGKLISDRDQTRLAGAGIASTMAEIKDPAQPVLTVKRAVPLDWLDYNGHMNESRYLECFSAATDRMMHILGCTPDYIAKGGSYFTAETHLRHLNEAHAGAPIEVHTRILSGGGKKMLLWHEMTCQGELVATGETMQIHVSLETRRASEPSDEIAANIETFVTAQAVLGTPEGAGKAIGQR